MFKCNKNEAQNKGRDDCNVKGMSRRVAPFVSVFNIFFSLTFSFLISINTHAGIFFWITVIITAPPSRFNEHVICNLTWHEWDVNAFLLSTTKIHVSKLIKIFISLTFTLKFKLRQFRYSLKHFFRRKCYKKPRVVKNLMWKASSVNIISKVLSRSSMKKCSLYNKFTLQSRILKPLKLKCYKISFRFFRRIT